MSKYFVLLLLGVRMLRNAAQAETNVVVNGGFEAANSWQVDGTGAAIRSNASLANTGSGYLSLGGAAAANQSAYQTISIPSNAVAATLKIHLNNYSVTRSSSDTFTISVGDTNGNNPSNIFSETGTASDTAQGTSYYRPGDFDLSAYIGQTIRLYFLASMGFAGGSTFFDVDDVSVTVGFATDVPANDNFTNRIVLTGNTVNATATNTYATKEHGEPNHAGNSGGKSVWWSWTAPTNGLLTLSTSNTTFATLLAVYNGTTVTQLTRVASQAANQTGDGITRVRINVTTGTEYQIAVDGESGNSGVVHLGLSFVPKPFALVQGQYAGLFYDTNGVALESAGFFSGKVTDVGKFSVKLQFASETKSVSDHFGGDGSFSKTFQRPGKNPLIVVLQMDFNTRSITGHVSDGVWIAPLLANRYDFSLASPAPQFRKSYTVALPPPSDLNQGPGGFGAGTVSVDIAGRVFFSGTLGDGTRLTERTFVSVANVWPMFASLYSGKGLILGWIDCSSGRPVGNITWIKSPQPKAKFYPAGFTLADQAVFGSSYLTVAGHPPFNWTNSTIVLQNGNLAQSITNYFVIGKNLRVTSTNKLSLSITPLTGLFRGSVVDPATGKRISLSGVILQNEDAGLGSFMGTTQSGSVLINP